MIEREQYMKRIVPYIDKPFIKVLTGIRRCGKSTIMLLLREKLLEDGVPEGSIVHINFENMDFADLNTAEKLHSYVTAAKEKHAEAEPDKKFYLLFDEIQEVEGWEKAVNSFFSGGGADIYVTGSNSRLLSSELATYIAGRYVEIGVHPLSFAEYILFKKHRTGSDVEDVRAEFPLYIRYGGFPAIHTHEYEPDEAYGIVSDIYSSVILRDIVQRHGIRNIDLLDRVVRFVFDNIGNTFSAKNVADYFKSQRKKVDTNTVYKYLDALESAFIVKRARRYDIKGREILKTMEKFYVADQSLVYAAMGYKDRLIGGVLENIVHNELVRRGFKVFVGKLDEREIDFIAERGGEKIYIQVAYRISDSRETVEREFSPLMAVRDNYPKYVLTMDDFWSDNVEGIKHMHVADFLVR